MGKRASVAMKEIEAKIDLFNLTTKKAEPMTVNNNTNQLTGVGNRVAHGDDNSVNAINEK
jgi:acetate kinase